MSICEAPTPTSVPSVTENDLAKLEALPAVVKPTAIGVMNMLMERTVVLPGVIKLYQGHSGPCAIFAVLNAVLQRMRGTADGRIVEGPAGAPPAGDRGPPARPVYQDQLDSEFLSALVAKLANSERLSLFMFLMKVHVSDEPIQFALTTADLVELCIKLCQNELLWRETFVAS